MILKGLDFLKPLPFPQGEDPTNCVLYAYANLLGDFPEALKAKRKKKDGHNTEEEIRILRLLQPFFGGHNVFPYSIACNGGSDYDGLTVDQVESSIRGSWAMDFDSKNWFYPVFATVASQVNIGGLHRVVFFTDGYGYKTPEHTRIILADSQLGSFVQFNSLKKFVQYYKTVHDMQILTYFDGTLPGLRQLYFQKSKYNHIPWK